MNYAAVLGAEPDEVARPTTIAEVAALVAQAGAGGRAVIPWGTGTGQDHGYLPRRADIVLDLSNLNRIVAHEPGDLTVTVEAGARLADVQALLAAHHQFLPLDPPGADQATIGGLLATNAFGPLRLGYGQWRDWLIGLSVVDARGRVVKGGGKVVKNVTGYDLPKLHIGALGTLGVIVEATFKVAPRPEAMRASLFTLHSDGDAAAFLGRVHRETSPALSLVSETGPSRLAVLAFAGPTEAVESELTKAAQIAGEAGLPPPTALPPGVLNPFASAAEKPLVRLVGRADNALARHEAVAEQEAWTCLETLPGTGQTDAFAAGGNAEAALAAMIKWAERNDARLAVLHAPAALRGGNVDLWRPLPPAFALMKRLKETLDPHDTLNPGRFVGRL